MPDELKPESKPEEIPKSMPKSLIVCEAVRPDSQYDEDEEFGLEPKSVEARISEMTKTTLMRAGVLYLYKIWQSLELLSFLGAAVLLVWGGTKLKSLDSYWDKKDFLELLIIAGCSMLFARIGWNMPDSRFKQIVSKYTNLRKRR